MGDDINFIIDQGADWPVVLFEQNDDGSPMDFTECTAELIASFMPGGKPVLFTLSTDDGSLVLDSADYDVTGTISWRVPGAVTALYVPQGMAPVPGLPKVAYHMAFYTLNVVSASGQILREHAGQLRLSLEN